MAMAAMNKAVCMVLDIMVLDIVVLDIMDLDILYLFPPGSNPRRAVTNLDADFPCDLPAVTEPRP